MYGYAYDMMDEGKGRLFDAMAQDGQRGKVKRKLRSG
jgi:hypothetical protein